MRYCCQRNCHHMVALDTDVLLLAYAFHNDERQADNSRLLALAQERQPVVAIYTVMELLGQLSFNLPPERLQQWQYCASCLIRHHSAPRTLFAYTLRSSHSSVYCANYPLH